MSKTKPSVTDEVAAKIKVILFSGELEHGQKLPGENKLAERLGVGRSSVREALKQLAASGYIELLPNRGAFAAVTSSDELPSPKDGAVSWLSVNRDSVDELLNVRRCIEPYAAELCASHISDAELARLRGVLDSFAEAVEKKQFENLPQLDFEFHRLILDNSGNRFLVGMYSKLLQLFMQYSKNSFRVTDSKQSTLAEHKAVYDAIAARSPAEAHLAMSLHISIAARRMNEICQPEQ